MKPKISTGYLTPQSNRIQRVSTPTRSESNDDLNLLTNANESFFAKLMTCPIKRQLILNLISSEKENVNENKKKQADERTRNQLNGSPISKIQKKHQCESPTALFRRRALKQQARQSLLPENESDVDRNRSNSRQSYSSGSVSPVPFVKLLEGVVAYVEIRSRDDHDRSSGAKVLMRSMGAVVRDSFTKDVTHVVFKDGSFTTYQKAKLMKVHLVSVLWIEAVRSSNMRVPEKKFPALGTEDYDHNVSSICSKMQKDYEEIIREEVHRSLVTGTPLPSTKSLISRRRTMMTPLPSSSQNSSQLPSTQDREIEEILTKNSTRVDVKLSPEITSDDDSDLGPCINGSIISNKNKKSTQDIIFNSVDYPSSMELTPINNSESLYISKRRNGGSRISECSMEQTPSNRLNKISVANSFYNKQTPKLPSQSTPTQKSQQKHPEHEFELPDDSLYRRKTRQLVTRSNSLSDISLKENPSTNPTSNNASKSGHLKILSKNSCNITPDRTNQISGEKNSFGKSSTSTNMSVLQISDSSTSKSNVVSSNIEKSTSTNMSSLQISSDSEKNTKATRIQTTENSTSTNMSALVISSASNISQINPSTKNKKVRGQEKSFNSTDDNSFSPLNVNTMKNVMEILDDVPLSDENVTKRRRGRPSKKVLSSGNGNDDKNSKNDGASPQKQLKSVDAVNKDIDNNIDKRDILRKKSEPTTKKDSLPVKSRKTLGLRRKTILPYHPTTEETTVKDLPSPPKKAKGSSSEASDSEIITNRKSLRRRKKNGTEHSSLENNMQESKCTSEESDLTGSDKKRRLRKLYNPDDSVDNGIGSDEQEREQKRTEVTKRRSNEGVILNPAIISVASNILLTAKAKEYIEKNNINVNAILEKELEQPDQPTQKKGRKKKNEEKRISIDSDADEQKELAEQFLNKKTVDNTRALSIKLTKGDIDNIKKPSPKSAGKVVKRRQSARLSQRPRKNLKFNSSTSSNEEKVATSKGSNRRSTLEFQPLSQRSAKKKLKIDKSKQPSIVCTRLHKDDIQVFTQIVKKLGGFVIEDEVSDKTTHLVAGEPKRTVNMLRAIARGCWVLKHEWLLKSLEEGKWLPEEDYEETDFSSAVQKCRLQRQAFGPSFSMDILKDCGPIYISRGSIPRCSDLRELVSLCKGKVVTIPRNASIVVGEQAKHEGVTCVKETWLLDSITFNRKMPFKKYIIKQGNESPHV